MASREYALIKFARIVGNENDISLSPSLSSIETNITSRVKNPLGKYAFFPLLSSKRRGKMRERGSRLAKRGSRKREREREKFERVMARGGMTNQLLVVQLQGPTHSTDITGTITFRPLHLRRGAKGRGDEKLHDARLRIRPPATNRPSPPPPSLEIKRAETRKDTRSFPARNYPSE